MQEQTAQIKDAFSDRLEEMLEKPIQLPNGFKIETIGAVFSFNNTHEGVHMGYMNALKRTIERQTK
nr:DinB family protein [Thermoactinomyces sp. CICC 10522]